MPELNIEHHWACQTSERWEREVEGSKGKVYVVTFGPNHGIRDGAQFDYSCTCAAFKYGKGQYCKHIKQVEAERCNWQAFWDDGEPVMVDDERSCPKCGGPVTVHRHAV